MNNESLSVSRDHKGCVFDIICKDTNDDRFLIEVQTSQAVNIVERIIYYTCRLMDRMGKRGIYAYSKMVDPCWVNRFILLLVVTVGGFSNPSCEHHCLRHQLYQSHCLHLSGCIYSLQNHHRRLCGKPSSFSRTGNNLQRVTAALP